MRTATTMSDSPDETLRLEKARALVSLCASAPGAFSAIAEAPDALLIWAAVMRSERYSIARSKLLSLGHPEHDITYVEKEALQAAVAVGHPLPGQRSIP